MVARWKRPDVRVLVPDLPADSTVDGIVIANWALDNKHMCPPVVLAGDFFCFARAPWDKRLGETLEQQKKSIDNFFEGNRAAKNRFLSDFNRLKQEHEVVSSILGKILRLSIDQVVPDNNERDLVSDLDIALDEAFSGPDNVGLENGQLDLVKRTLLDGYNTSKMLHILQFMCKLIDMANSDEFSSRVGQVAQKLTRHPPWKRVRADLEDRALSIRQNGQGCQPWVGHNSTVALGSGVTAVGGMGFLVAAVAAGPASPIIAGVKGLGLATGAACCLASAGMTIYNWNSLPYAASVRSMQLVFGESLAVRSVSSPQ